MAAAAERYEQGHDGVIRGLATFDREAANIQAGWVWASRNSQTDHLATELCRDYPNTGAYVLHLRQPARLRIVWLKCAIEACRALGDRRGEGDALGNLGSAHSALGHAQTAITFFEQCLAIAREIGNRRGEGNTLGNLGNAHMKTCPSCRWRGVAGDGHVIGRRHRSRGVDRRGHRVQYVRHPHTGGPRRLTGAGRRAAARR
ncbi:MAG TPA: tetratricopeptide repeat protein [Urbifossiella sp.]|nr:tetratricopeptide repeat protein [Urbifossiella sp.]